MSEKDIVIRMRQLWCCKGAEFARSELQAGWEEIERLREHVAELEKALRFLRDTVHEIAEWEELDGFAEAYDMCRALAEIIGGEDD